jgi:hypothetical protein
MRGVNLFPISSQEGFRNCVATLLVAGLRLLTLDVSVIRTFEF